MLENKEFVRKFKSILIVIISIIFILGSSIKVEAIGSGNGTINPIYKPEWVIDRDESGNQKIYIDKTDEENPKLKITVKGSAYASQTIDTNTSVNYASDVTSTLAKEDIKIYIDDVEVTETTNPTITVEAGQTSTNANSGKNDIKHTIILSNLEKATRVAGVPYKEWSGNITIKIAGRGKLSNTYNENVLTDDYGNQNMMETDQGQTGDTWIDVNFKDATTNTNADGTLFADFTKPEFTYRYNGTTRDASPSENPEIDYGNKKLVVVFDVTDKYFNNTDLATVANIEEQIIVKMSDYTDELLNSSIEKSIEKIEDIYYPENSTTKVGEKYQLVLTKLQKEENDGFDFSGYMSITFPSNIVTDHSGNQNDSTTIAIGINDTDGNTQDNPGQGVLVDVVDPIVSITEDKLSGRNGLSSINRTDKTVAVVIEGQDKYIDISKQNLFNTDFKNQMKVRIVEHDGDIIEDASATELKLIKADGTIITDQNVLNAQYGETRISKTVVGQSATNSSTAIAYKVTLSNFGEIYEGKVSLIIPKGVFVDTSKNENEPTEVFVGNSTYTDAFKDSIVDFTKPTWEYETSSITRNRANETGTVTVEILGKDNYYASNTLTKEVIEVYVNDVINTDIVKDLQPIEDVECGYTLTLSNFGTNDGQVKIIIPENKILDTSNNGNIETTIYVGNPEWIETDVETDNVNPIYTAFRPVKDAAGNVSGSIVDFIKPVITLGTATLDREDSTVEITFDATDTNYLSLDKLSTNVIDIGDIQIFVDTGNNEKNVTSTIGKDLQRSTEQITKVVDGKTILGYSYTLTLDQFALEELLEDEDFLRHSGQIKLVIAADQIADTSGNKNKETTFIITEFIDEDETIEIVDFVKPIIYSIDKKYVDWEDKFALITVRATDRFYDTNTELKPEHITLYEEYLKEDGTTGYRDITNRFVNNIEIVKSAPLKDVDGNIVGYDYTVRLTDVTEEFKLKVSIQSGVIGDTSGNTNEAYTIEQNNAVEANIDNKKPSWKYVSSDTTQFEQQGKLSFTVKGTDKFLDLENSKLEYTETVKDLKVLLNGETIENPNITVTHIEDGEEATGKYKLYKIDITGLTQRGIYSLVFLKDVSLIDEDENKNAATTISFSKSIISHYDEDDGENKYNTNNYQNITYHVSHDLETVHSSNVHELMSVNITGTNFENEKFKPSTLGELYNNGENPLFAEPIYDPQIAADGYTVNYVYSPMSFAGWAEAAEDGTPIYYEDASLETVSETQTSYMKIYGLYDEIPNTITNLRAIWQDATVVFVASTGSDSDNGELATPVKTLEAAYSKLNTSGNSTNNIIVIMDKIEWDENTTLTGNATITSLYAGVDYRKTKNAELKISSNMIVNGDITFDNIELYSSSETVSNGNNYLGNGDYDNMLISNYSGNIILGRGITTTAEGKYTFGAIVGGNFETQTGTSNLGTHTIRVEAGKYNNIIAGSSLSVQGETTKFVTHQVIIGNIRDTAIPENAKLTITGYVAIGENENICYPDGATGVYDSYDKPYSTVTLYSGTFTGTNKFKKASEDAVIYARSINGKTEGIATFKMFGGVVTGNIYAGARVATQNETEICNNMYFYGGQVTGNIFGQGATDAFTGSTAITLQGCFKMTGNVFGGSNATGEGTGNGNGNTSITVNSSSAVITGNIYGGSNGVNNSGYITGTTNITLKSGNVKNIYGSGNNSGNSSNVIITMQNGTVSENIIGGAYNSQAGTTSTITVLGGTVTGNIYGGNINTTQEMLDNDLVQQDVKIIIGDTEPSKSPAISGRVYGSGKYDEIDTVEIQLIESTISAVYGGSEEVNSKTETVNIYLNGMTVNDIYGGGKTAGTVTTANLYLQSGTATNVYGGGNSANVTTSNISSEGIVVEITNADGTTENVQLKATVGTIFGGSNTSGIVDTSNISLKIGNITNVFGGGSSSNVGTANITLDGVTITDIYGGSKDAGETAQTNITLKTGNVANVFGGGLNTGVGTTKIKQEGATVKTIFGGNNNPGTGDGGNAGTTSIEIINSTVENIYGGNKDKGTVTNSTNITIHGNSTITGKLYGGGYKSNVGTSETAGSTTINIAGGTINKDINGGSEEGKVYGTTTINVGKDATDSTDSTDSTLTAGNINIKENIYGSGSTTNSNYNYESVVGTTYILLDNSEESPITFDGSIFGAGKGSTYVTDDADGKDKSRIHLKDFGTSTSTHQITSIERTGDVYIGTSFIELLGRQDINNREKNKSYSLNRITNALTIYDSTWLYTRRGFNIVGGFNSYKGISDMGGTIYPTAVATALVSTSGVTTNTDNRLYTFEGVNLIFVKEEGDIYQKANHVENIWGKVSGMTFFGMYALDRTDGHKIHDIYAPDSDIYYESYDGEISEEKFFANGTFVEAQHKTSHNITIDGFYTNVATYGESVTIKPKLVGVTDGGNYYDWIINEDIVNYSAELIASISGAESMADILLDYKYRANATYQIDAISFNSLNIDVDLVNPLDLSLISEDSHEKLGLIMKTDNSGWLNKGTTNIYTVGTEPFVGEELYKTDDTTTPGTIRFKLYNSVNITETKDLGFVNIVLVGKTPESADGTVPANTFKVVIALNLLTKAEPQNQNYVPRFTDNIETELNYTQDSKVDLTYTMYKETDITPYESGDYRVLTTTTQLPEGTRITLKDYVTEKVYYYHVTGTETEYKLLNFTEMDNLSTKYTDNNSAYFKTAEGEIPAHAVEKYDISIDFIDAVDYIDEAVVQSITQQTYLELKNSSGVKFNNGTTQIKYNLHSGKNAIISETISNAESSYSVVESLDIPFVLNASMIEQDNVFDTKYYDQIAGISVQIINEQTQTRIKSPELQNFKLTNNDTGEIYEANSTGVIRMPIMGTLSQIIDDNYTITVEQAKVTPGIYTCLVHFYTADDGLYYGSTPMKTQKFYITFISKLLGTIGIEATEDSRIISKSTGENLEGNKGVDMTVSVGKPTSSTNIRIELFKRDTTYTITEDSTTYNGISYTSVDISQYLKGTWEKPSKYGLTAENENEYILSPKTDYGTGDINAPELKVVEIERELQALIKTGEYKLVIKAYNDNTLVQTVKKTFIVTQ